MKFFKLSSLTTLGLLWTVFSCQADTNPAKAPPLTLQSGDLTLRFAPGRAWTFDEILFKGQLLTVPASQSGLVLNFGGAQFLGSGHKEGGTEKVESIQLQLDGKKGDALQGGERSGKVIELVKESTLGQTRLKSIIRLQDNGLECEQILTPQEDVPVNLIYAFMFPWTTTTTEWMAKTVKDTMREGGFTSRDRAWELRDDVQWSAIYNPELHIAALTVYDQESQKGAGVKHGYWNIHKGYHKQYYQPLAKTTLTKDKTYHWKVTVHFIQADAQQWKQAVQNYVSDKALN